MAALLEDWRDDLRWPPASALVSPEEAVEALRTGLADRAARPPWPGDDRVGGRDAVGPERLRCHGGRGPSRERRCTACTRCSSTSRGSMTNQVMLSAKADLAKVQQMIDQGQWDQAQNQLAEVSSAVQSMNDGASRHDLMDQVNLLNTRVEIAQPERDAAPPGCCPGAQPKPPKAPAASTTPTVSPAPATTPPPPGQSPSPSSTPSAIPSPTPSSGRHRHHGQTPTPPSVAPGS